MRFSFACDWTGRLKGLLPDTQCCNPSEALLIVPCHDIHTVGMSGPIDVAFIDKEGYVCRTYVNLQPNQRLSDRRACAVLERRTPAALREVAGEIPEDEYALLEDGWFHTGERVGLISEPFIIEEADLEGEAEEYLSEIASEEEFVSEFGPVFEFKPTPEFESVSSLY